jgi:hypothetical protein
MRTTHVWIEIVVLSTAIACALALLIATLGTAAGAAVGRVEMRQVPQQATPRLADQTYEGLVTCSRCGPKHSAALGQAVARCVRTCVRDGASFALAGADTTYLLEGDLNLLKAVAGQRARIVGALNGKTIRVSSLAGES